MTDAKILWRCDSQRNWEKPSNWLFSIEIRGSGSKVAHCNTCGSTRLNKLRAELALHFSGLKNINKPVLWNFPEVAVCTGCGEADFHIPPHELQWWAQDAQRKHTRVIFIDPIIVQTCRACGSSELRTYSSELTLDASGRGNLDKRTLLMFPHIPVCRDYGAARFTVQVSEFHPWLTELSQ